MEPKEDWTLVHMTETLAANRNTIDALQKAMAEITDIIEAASGRRLPIIAQIHDIATAALSRARGEPG